MFTDEMNRMIGDLRAIAAAGFFKTVSDGRILFDASALK